MNLKKILKFIRLHEETISILFGAGLVAVVAIIGVRYLRNKGKIGMPSEVSIVQESEQKETQTTEEKNTYIVKTGDSLWKIAEDIYGSGFNWVYIAKENNLKDPNILTPGQELKLPKEGVKTISTIPDEPIHGASYTVKKGDSLWKIAVRAYGDGYKWIDIARENRLSNPNLIHSGNVLVIPR